MALSDFTFTVGERVKVVGLELENLKHSPEAMSLRSSVIGKEGIVVKVDGITWKIRVQLDSGAIQPFDPWDLKKIKK